MRVRRVPSWTACQAVGPLLLLAGCLSDPLGPKALLIETPTIPPGLVLTGAPGQLLNEQVRVRTVNEDGRPVAGAAVRWVVVGTNARVESAATFTGRDGSADAAWVLGTVAAEAQRLAVEVRTTGHAAATEFSAVAVPSDVAVIRFLAETTIVKVGQPATIPFEAIDPFGNRFRPEESRFQVADTMLAQVDSNGSALGVRRGYSRVVVSAGSVADTAWLHVTQVVSEIGLPRDTIKLHSLGQQHSLSVSLVDDHGFIIQDSLPVAMVGDPSIVQIVWGDDGLAIRALANGFTRLVVRAGADSVVVPVLVAQRASRVAVSTDTIRFAALGDSQVILGEAVDSLGNPMPGGVQGLTLDDTSVATLSDSVTVRSRSNGSTQARFSVAGLAVSLPVVVSQVPETINVSVLGTGSIISVPLDSLIPLSCQVLDRNRFPLNNVNATVAPAARELWSGQTCDGLRVHRSGFDTVRVSYGELTSSLPVVLAVRPVVSNIRPLLLDSMPSGSGPWSPTARRNSQGQFEIYATGYVVDPVSGGFRGHLHRYVSADSASFAYDGIAVQRDDTLCALNGSGIENVAIVPRADGPGWRMFYAGGSFECYGWQVFSAVSSDERTWTKEPGIRISNGLPLSQPRGTVPWPAGEGMVVDQVAGGEWRMIASTYEPLQPPENRFQITEWRSPAQMTWTYRRTVFSTRELPPEGQRSVYSPTIREVAPGLWRMIFTADNLNTSGGRSRLWCAVSTDEVNWQLEGALLDSQGHDFYYSTLVDDQLVFLHAQAGLGHLLAIATVSMP
ncbi:MAG: hypothetical protein ACREMF_00560 [Gemmatimonadales bacterium]